MTSYLRTLYVAGVSLLTSSVLRTSLGFRFYQQIVPVLPLQSMYV